MGYRAATCFHATDGNHLAVVCCHLAWCWGVPCWHHMNYRPIELHSELQLLCAQCLVVHVAWICGWMGEEISC